METKRGHYVTREKVLEILKHAEVVLDDDMDKDAINIGAKVKILDIEENEEMEYKLVGSTEADSLNGKISNESPLGSALIGTKVGDVINVTTEFGEFQYKVLEIEK